ncbi:MAG: nuclease domain-containing protein, partial [Ktedonobacteraceae bacterium]
QFQFDVKKRVAGIVLAKDAWRIEMKYEPLYPKFVEGMKGLVSTDYERLTPDMAVEIYQEERVRQVIIFDAKYSWWQMDDGSYRPRDEHLGKMRKYRDMIRCSMYIPGNSRPKLQKIVTSSYILYPGTQLVHDQDEPEVGALPFISNMTEQERLQVESAVEDILLCAKLI